MDFFSSQLACGYGLGGLVYNVVHSLLQLRFVRAIWREMVNGSMPEADEKIKPDELSGSRARSESRAEKRALVVDFVTRQRFQEKWEPVFRPEPLRKKVGSRKSGNRFSVRPRNQKRLLVIAWPVLLEGCFLLGCRLALVLRLPLGIGHAIDQFAGIVLAERNAFGLGSLAVPVRQAVAAEAREVHQVDVLHVGAIAQMFHEPAESSGLEIAALFFGQFCHSVLP